MSMRFRATAVAIFVLLSSGCGSGRKPLPGGFPNEQTIENAAAVRVSKPGLAFVESALPAVVSKIANAPNGLLNVGIPSLAPPRTQVADLSVLGKVFVSANVCPGGSSLPTSSQRCAAAVNLGKSLFQIDALTPSVLRLRAQLPVVVEDTPIEAAISYDPPVGGSVNLGVLTLHLGYGEGGCEGGKPVVTPHVIPIEVSIPLVAESKAPRRGYAKVDIAAARITLDGLSAESVRVCGACGLASNVCSAVTDAAFVKNLVLNPIKNGLETQVRALLSKALCTVKDPALDPPCPTGSSPDPKASSAPDAACVFDADPGTCVSTLLGTDAHLDAGQLFESFSPGTPGQVDFVLAAGGALEPFPKLPETPQGRTLNGLSLGIVGGAEPKPSSACVPQVLLERPQGIAIPDVLAPLAPEASETPHVGFALARRFVDYGLGQLYNSGLFCLSVSSEQVSLLRSGLLSLLLPSLKTLTFEQSDAAVTLVTRPQAPPQVVLGSGKSPSDPLVTLTIPKLALDVYVWHLDRFVRVFTYQADVTVPVNLQTERDPVKNPNGGILPSIGDVRVANASVKNADLLFDDPEAIARSLSGVLSGLGKQLGGGLAPLAVPNPFSSLGVGLDVGEITKLTKNADDYVGVFATFSNRVPAKTKARTTLALRSKHVATNHMQLATMSRDGRPVLVVDRVSEPLENAENEAGYRFEYAWWIDGGTRSPWSRARARAPDEPLVIDDDQLFLQGRHVLHVATRVAGSSDETASLSELPFTIDALAPFVKLQHDAARARVTVNAWDLVSEKNALLARFRLERLNTTEPPSPWNAEFQPLATLGAAGIIDVAGARAIELEVKDEEGNVRLVREPLVHGDENAAGSNDGSGASCQTAGAGLARADNHAVIALALGFGAFLGTRRRRRARACVDRGASRKNVASAAVLLNALVVLNVFGCGSEPEKAEKCGADCAQECKPPRPLGLPGSYLSIAKSADGTLWAAGYNEALLEDGENQLWGDLVVGPYDAATQTVAWQTVDGVPPRAPGTCADRAASSWRNGESDPGDNVGLWTSLQVSPSGAPLVTYEDATHKSLKFATRTESGWNVFTLAAAASPLGDVGRYAKMVLVEGKPVVAYLHVEPNSEGNLRSKVMLARALVEVPSAPDDFRFEQIAVEETNPCSQGSCGASRACVKATSACAPMVSGCTPSDCGASRACVDEPGKGATCVPTKSAIQTDLDVFGDFIALAEHRGRLGLVVYDKPRNSLMALEEQSAGGFQRTVVTENGGASASLAIDEAGQWHIAYVSEPDARLRYVAWKSGLTGVPTELIDDGFAVDGQAFLDGKHRVGSDSAIRVEGNAVTVLYQDATAGVLRQARAVRDSASASGSPSHASEWLRRAIPQPGMFGGFSPQFVPGEPRVATFGEQTSRDARSRIGNVTLLPL